MKYIKEAPRYNLCTPKQNSPYLHAHILPLFVTDCQKGNHDSSSKGGGCGVEPLAQAKSARKAQNSVSTSKRS